MIRDQAQNVSDLTRGFRHADSAIKTHFETPSVLGFHEKPRVENVGRCSFLSSAHANAPSSVFWLGRVKRSYHQIGWGWRSTGAPSWETQSSRQVPVPCLVEPQFCIQLCPYSQPGMGMVRLQGSTCQWGVGPSFSLLRGQCWFWGAGIPVAVCSIPECGVAGNLRGVLRDNGLTERVRGQHERHDWAPGVCERESTQPRPGWRDQGSVLRTPRDETF